MALDGLGAYEGQFVGGIHHLDGVKCGRWVLMAKNGGGPPSPWCCNDAEGVA